MLSRRLFMGFCLANAGNLVVRRTTLAEAAITFDWRVPSSGAVRKAFVIAPPSPKPSRRAVCYFPAFWEGGWSLPEGDEPNVRRFLEAGLYVVGLDQGETFGAFRSEWWAFAEFFRRKWGISGAMSGWGRSRGGMWAFNLAADGFFDRVAGVAPLTARDSYGAALIAKVYADVDLSRNIPNERAAELVKSGVSMMIAHGDSDLVVSAKVNSLTLADRYAAAGGRRLKTFIVKNGTHESVTRAAYDDLIEFIVRDDLAF